MRVLWYDDAAALMCICCKCVCVCMCVCVRRPFRRTLMNVCMTCMCWLWFHVCNMGVCMCVRKCGGEALQ